MTKNKENCDNINIAQPHYNQEKRSIIISTSISLPRLP